MLAQSIEFAADSTIRCIDGIDAPVVLRYFNTLNEGDFHQVSLLFAEAGVLEAPFEDQIVGAEAIAAYLAREAKGFVLQPESGTTTPLEDGRTQVAVIGRVQTPLFSVNVGWLLILNPVNQLSFVQVKLLASLQELLQLRK